MIEMVIDAQRKDLGGLQTAVAQWPEGVQCATTLPLGIVTPHVG